MDLFLTRSVPYMARGNYLVEVKHLLLWGVFVGMFEGAASSIVVAKTFNGGPWLITIVMAMPMIANLAGLLWGSIAAVRPKLPLFMVFGVGTILLIGSVGLTPESRVGGFVFVAQIGLARTLLAGCVTVRSGLWKHNYPAAMRGRIAARLQIVRYSLGIGVVTLVAVLFDVNPSLYVVIYPIVAVIGSLGLLQMRRMHVRGERALMSDLRRRRASGEDVFRRHGILRPLSEAVDVLRQDAAFRRYCIGMMLLGTGNIMIFPVMAIIVTKELPLGYMHSSVLLETLPQLIMMLSMMSWAGLFDRRGVVRFRVLNAATWALASVFGGLAALMLLVPGAMDSVALFATAVTMVALSRLFEGLGRGGGAIGWNLGHLHFAEPSRAEIYMGAHVFLTGLRGLTAPFIGTLVYQFAGPLVFLFSAALGFAGMMTFRSLLKGDAVEDAVDDMATVDLSATADVPTTQAAARVDAGTERVVEPDLLPVAASAENAPSTERRVSSL